MEWKEVRLGDVCEIFGRIGFRGYTTNDLVDTPKEGAISLSPKNIINGELNLEQCTYIKWDKYYESPEIMINPNEIVITKTGSSVGRTTFVRRVVHPMTLNPQLVVLKNISENAEFLSYYIKSALFQSVLKSIVVGSAIPTLSQKNLANIMIKLPKEVNDQHRIASILSSLDRKIELNNKINADLEEMAQAIFKNWFVDFEPFKDGKFVDSELGMIPEGWKVGKITDIGCLITDYVSNGSFASLKQNVHLYETKEYAQFIRNTDLKTNTFSVYVDKHSYDFLSKSTLYGNEIIISNVGDVGSVHLCPKLDIPMTLGNNIIMLRPNEKEYNYFLYLWFKYFSGQGLIQGIKGGSAQPKFNKTDFKNLPLLIPSFEIIEKSYWIFESMFSILSSNVKESSRLSTLRDTLLPRLMSGELEVPE